MKNNACYAGLFRVKLVGFGSSSNFSNKKIMLKKTVALKNRAGWDEKHFSFFPLNQEKILFEKNPLQKYTKYRRIPSQPFLFFLCF